MEKQKTASDIVVEAINEFCNDYCKHQEKFANVGEDDKRFDELINKYCDNCPINKIV